MPHWVRVTVKKSTRMHNLNVNGNVPVFMLSVSSLTPLRYPEKVISAREFFFFFNCLCSLVYTFPKGVCPRKRKQQLPAVLAPRQRNDYLLMVNKNLNFFYWRVPTTKQLARLKRE